MRDFLSHTFEPAAALEHVADYNVPGTYNLELGRIDGILHNLASCGM
jgi:hypothetical protein